MMKSLEHRLMKYIEQPNAWSCAVASLAMILDKEFDEVIEVIGHDGSKIIDPGKPEPLNRMTFSYAELALAALRFGYALTQVPLKLGYHTGEGVNEFWPSVEWLYSQLDGPCMICLESIIPGWQHQVVWDGADKIYDPKYGIYNIPTKQRAIYLEILYPIERKWS